MPQISANDETIEEDTNVSDPEEDSKQFIAILIKCLALLNKIGEAVDVCLLIIWFNIFSILNLLSDNQREM